MKFMSEEIWLVYKMTLVHCMYQGNITLHTRCVIQTLTTEQQVKTSQDGSVPACVSQQPPNGAVGLQMPLEMNLCWNEIKKKSQSLRGCKPGAAGKGEASAFMEEVKSRGPYIYSVLESAQAFLTQHPFEEVEESNPNNKARAMNGSQLDAAAKMYLLPRWPPDFPWHLGMIS
uniref:Uncharacterized protein n=1 Tax=Sphaerodactylus townsendi TaxID=933632 RepID=A0ACB8FX80_9SAUR